LSGGILSGNIWVSPVDDDERRDTRPCWWNEGQCKSALICARNNEPRNDSESDDGKPNREQTNPSRIRIPLAQRPTQLTATQVADKHSAHQDRRNPIRCVRDVKIVKCQEQSDADENSDGELNQLCLGLGV